MSPSKKRQRLSAEQTRVRVLAAGYQLMEENGLSIGLERVGINEAIARAGVSRTSAYRLFASETGEPQDSFRLQLVAHLLSDVAETTSVAISDTKALLDAMVLDEPPDQLALTLREVLRMAGNANQALARDDKRSFLFFASLATANTEPTPNEPLEEVLARNEAVQTERYVELFASLAALFGLRVRPAIGWATFGGLAASASHGVSSRTRFNPGLRDIRLPTGPDGTEQSWTPEAMNFLSLVLMAWEPDPDATVSADLTVWLQSD